MPNLLRYMPSLRGNLPPGQGAGPRCYFMDDMFGGDFDWKTWYLDATAGHSRTYGLSQNGVWIQNNASGNGSYSRISFAFQPASACINGVYGNPFFRWSGYVYDSTDVQFEVGLLDYSTSSWVSWIYYSSFGPNWYMSTNDGGSRYSVDSGVPLATWTNTSLSFVCSSTDVKYFYNGLYKGTITTQLPSAVLFPFFMVINRSTVARSMVTDRVEFSADRAP